MQFLSYNPLVIVWNLWKNQFPYDLLTFRYLWQICKRWLMTSEKVPQAFSIFTSQ